MNRIHHPPRPVEEVPSPPTFEIEPSLFTPPAHDTSHALFAPLHYEPKYAYPLIVWLHGPGTVAEGGLTEVMTAVSLRNYVAAAPRGFQANEERSGTGRLDWPQTEEHIAETERRVFHAIEAASAKCNVAANRVFIAGFGSGGTMAFRVAMRQPGRFAGVLSLCGGFPRGHNPLAQLPLARKIPMFLTVGRDSLDYSPDAACDDLRLFHTAGISVALRQYPCAQELCEQMLRDVDRWIIDEITSPGDPPADSDGRWAFSPE